MNNRSRIFVTAFAVWMFAIATPLLADETLTYISPGVRFGYHFDEGPTLGFKISLGSFYADSFFNITLGTNFPVGNRVKKPHEKYQFVELQAGTFKNPIPLGLGGGIGIAFSQINEQPIIAPKISLFGGYLAFATMDMVFFKNNEIRDFGLEFVLPLPVGLKGNFLE